MSKRFSNRLGLAVLATLALTALVAAPSAAQDPPPLASLFTVHTDLGAGPGYEANLKELWKAFKKAGADRPVQVSTTPDEPGDYNFVVGFESWADQDAWDAMLEKAYDSVPDLVTELQSASTGNDWSLWRHRPDLSYTPAKPRLTPEEAVYTRVTFLRPHPNKAQALQELMTEVVALRKKHGLNVAAEAWQLWAGADGPAFAVLVSGKNPADVFTQNEKDLAKMGADWQAVVQKAAPLLRELSYSDMLSRPDLGYTP